ncbi:MAG: Antitoxin [Hydrocarboniphaga sp.]|uniref:type II toxin-antitoxin system Phd/YefM family antitoxin n=1 Tax=Hydrocarboniphaga sp. TaxID=2033016 RepID=UPI002637EA56|nr:type II toxin-antitoxin system prevent-host-death family antitoxin [Hydrocarboniphaga sp.]MDB5970188.1 Antitoxin [Hydrocarboniphaga sp.]
MSVTVRELKAHLSEYLRRVERGETLMVTLGGRVVALLVPPPAVGESLRERLARQSWFRAAPSPGPVGLDPPETLDDSLPSLSDIVRQQRRS